MSSSPAVRLSIALLIIISISFSLSAQTRFNFFGGPQISSVNYTIRGSKQDVNIKPGFQLGAGAKIEFDNRLFFSPAVYYSLKGYKVKFNEAAAPPDLNAINNNVSVHTLETAFLLEYDFNKTPSHVFIKFGPSLDFQLLGKEKFDRTDGEHISRNMKYGFTSYGRYAANAVLHVGYEMDNSVFFYGYYQHGLSDLNNADFGPTIHYRIAGISVGKYFK